MHVIDVASRISSGLMPGRMSVASNWSLRDHSIAWRNLIFPTRHGDHYPVVTLSICAWMMYIFAFMAGQFAFYKVVELPGVAPGNASSLTARCHPDAV